MSLVNGMDFDSFWLSDNQSPYEGMRIFKDTLLRMPPQMIEKWAAIQSVCDFGHYCTEGAREKIIAANDALWQDVRGINESCLEGFLTGGAVCFSCDLNSFSDELFLSLKNFVAQFKKERDFWRTAVCRILVDTESVLVLEYSDRNFEKAELLVYTNRIRQSSLLIYPKLDGASSYRLNGGEIQKGALAEARGIEVTLEGNFKSKRISLERIRVVS